MRGEVPEGDVGFDPGVGLAGEEHGDPCEITPAAGDVGGAHQLHHRLTVGIAKEELQHADLQYGVAEL